MSNLPKSGAVFFAKDLPLLARFYGGVAGLVVTHAETGVMVLESASQQLVLHGIPGHAAKKITINSPPTRRTDVAIKLIFPVPSITDARRDALALGGVLDPVKKEFEARGFRACDGHDPEGNVIQFREQMS